MSDQLKNKKIAILATEGFEPSELTEPKKALEEAGATTQVISLETGSIRGMSGGEWGDEVAVDMPLDKARARDFDGLHLPGGVLNPDTLRTEGGAIGLIKEFYELGKPIGAICHAPWLLIEAGVVEGLKVTSWPSVKTDLKNAGAEWVDSECVCDKGVVTSRNPDDIPAYNSKIIEEFQEGKHQR